jgi:parallel beta-helix repeat protein
MKQKLLLFLYLIIFCFAANATTYYVAANGNDSNSGTSSSTPWKSVAKVNASFSSMNAGDNVLFNMGDVFYGSLIVNKSGTANAPITIGAYGSGNKPVITGLSSITSWSNLGSNIWESTLPVSSLSYTNLVLINGVNTAMGRTPNAGTFYNYQSQAGIPLYNGASAFSITSSDLTGSPNWTGAELATYVTTYGLNRVPITSQNGGTLNWADPTNLQEGFEAGVSEFFIQNDPRTLDQVNEWYYNPSTHKLRIYNTVSPANVQIATIDTLASIGASPYSLLYGNGNDYVTFSNLSFQGSNKMSLLIRNSKFVSVENCDFNFAGTDAINGPYWGNSTGVKIENCTFNNTNNTAIGLVEAFDHGLVNGNTFHNTGAIVGMGAPAGSYSYTGLYSAVHTLGIGTLIKYNSIDSTGYTGITMRGDSSVCQNNFVSNALIFLHDGGGIYTWNNPGGLNPHVGMKIINNIVLNVQNDVGIYTDDNSNGIEVYGNTVANCKNGFYVHNNWNMNLHDNTAYNCSYSNLNVYHDIFSITQKNNVIKNNIFFGKISGQRTGFFYPADSVKTGFTVLDSNYYANAINDSLTIDGYYSGTWARKTLLQWQSAIGKDLHSKKSPLAISDTNLLHFYYNASASPMTLNFPFIGMDVTGKSYNGSITLNPYASVILIKTATIQNMAPKANAGKDSVIILPQSSILLIGQGTDSDGTISSYSWRQISGPSVDTISTPNYSSTNITGLIQGVYQFELSVTDNSGAVGKDTMNLTVNPMPNILPVAYAGTDQIITLPANSVLLNGNGTESNGNIVSLSWATIGGPNLPTIVNAGNAFTNVTGLIQGVYFFELKVTDSNNKSGRDTMRVTVNAITNNPPIAYAGNDQVITLPTNIVSLSGSGVDASGTITNYLWTKIGGPLGSNIVNPSSPITDVSGLVQGTYQFELKITDNNAAVGKDTMIVQVNAAANIAPTSNAGADQTITLPTNNALLSGSGNDPNGTIASYLWTKISGPSSGTIANSTLPSATATGLVQGAYAIELKVTDNSGATGRDTVIVTVNPAANIPPVANAGMDQGITLPINSTTLTGKGSDADGSISSYSWTKISGPSSGVITNATSAYSTVTGLVQGIYQFELKVTDNVGATGRDTMQLTVNPAPNIPPVAFAGSDKVITLPTNIVSLSGTGTDVGGYISSYLWTKVSGPASSSIVNAASPITDVAALTQGVYQFELKVTDNNGAIGKDTMQIIVNAAPNIAPVANAGSDIILKLPVNYANLSGAGTDADGTISSYMWSKVSGPSAGTIANTSSAVTSVSGLVQGIYQFELKVTDNSGAIAKDTMEIVVNAATNIPPIANAGIDQTITLPINSVSLTGKGTDADGTISFYAWTQVAGPSIATISKPNSASTTVTGLIKGIYLFELKVTDNSGASSRDTVQVTVNPAPNIPPVAYAGVDQTITLPTNSTSVAGTGTDADGTISSYLWTKISGPTVFNIVNSVSPVTDISSLVQGVYLFELKVTDNNGAIAKDTMQVTVNPEVIINIPPHANAGSDQAITLPTDSLTLSGQGSDADGTIIKYVWTKISGPANFIIANSSAASTIVTGLVQGVYLLELKVTDNSGATAADTMQVTVNAAIIVNIPPVANAGVDQSITLPANFTTLSGKASDIDGTITTYLWSQISGPATAVMSGQSLLSNSISALIQGVYQFEFKVTDNNGGVGRDTMTVTVNAAPKSNKVPIAKAGSSKKLILPINTTTLSGVATDEGESILSYKWTKISGPSLGNISDANSAITTVTGLVEGIYQYELKVTDSNGATGADTTSVTVIAATGIAPLANAGPDQTITLPINSVILSGSASDSDGTITNYSWKQVAGPADGIIVNSDSAVTIVNELIPGNYQFEFSVTDNSGIVGKDTVDIVVGAPRLNLDIKSNSFKVYPNPVITNTTLDFSIVKPDTKLDVVITNMLGKVVYRKNIVTGQNNIKEILNLSNLAKGIYAITVYFNNGEKQSRLLTHL